MAQLLNITGSRVVEDPSFRYKMPRLVCRIEGRGNGIRTCIVNLVDISSSLNRPPDILTKYFGVELGAQSRYEAEVRALLRGSAGWSPAAPQLPSAHCGPSCHPCPGPVPTPPLPRLPPHRPPPHTHAHARAG